MDERKQTENVREMTVRLTPESVREIYRKVLMRIMGLPCFLIVAVICFVSILSGIVSGDVAIWSEVIAMVVVFLFLLFTIRWSARLAVRSYRERFDGSDEFVFYYHFYDDRVAEETANGWNEMAYDTITKYYETGNYAILMSKMKRWMALDRRAAQEMDILGLIRRKNPRLKY